MMSYADDLNIQPDVAQKLQWRMARGKIFIQAGRERGCAIAEELEEISRKERHGENWLQFTEFLIRISSRLAHLCKENEV